jgi:hypothetical protein
MRSFINSFSAPCLLGPQSKNIVISNNLFQWTVNKKNHFSILNNLLVDDIEKLKSFCPANFHYVDDNNLNFLKKFFKVSRSKHNSTELNFDNQSINLPGSHYKNIRNAINKYDTKFIIKDNYNDIKDISNLINEWSDTFADKYFRDFSGKNFFYLKNNYHKECVNIFVYDNEKLISFGIASPPTDIDKNKYCTYIIGKALAKSYHGLSEYTDMLLYRKIFDLVGPFIVNMGQTEKGLVFYKNKFPNPTAIIHYDGKIELK